MTAAKILVRYLGCWGLGDLLCSEPMLRGLAERYGAGVSIFLEGRAGNAAYSPLVTGRAHPGLEADLTVEVRGFDAMDATAYGRLEALPSLVEHLCSYAGVRPADPRPRLHLGPAEVRRAAELEPRLPKRPRIAICSDFLDPLRHWPAERWQQVAARLAKAGAGIVEVGVKDRTGIGLDLVGALSVRETAAVLRRCDLFCGHSSGLLHYAQAAGVPCVGLFSLARPERFLHSGAHVAVVQATHLPCIDCMTRRFAAMQRQGCIAAPRGRCMLEIDVPEVLEAAAQMLEEDLHARARRAGHVEAT